MPHITIALLEAAGLEAARNRAQFNGVNVHLYIKGLRPASIHKPLGLAEGKLLNEGIAELRGYDAFRWASSRQSQQQGLAITDSITVDGARGVRRPSLDVIGHQLNKS